MLKLILEFLSKKKITMLNTSNIIYFIRQYFKNKILEYLHLSVVCKVV